MMAIAKTELNRPWPGQRILAVLARLSQDGVCVWSAQIREQAHVTTSQLNHSTGMLLERGYIARCYYLDEVRKHGGYRITPAGLAAHAKGLTLKSGSGLAQPRAASGARAKAWSVIRFRRKFSLDDLEMLCGGHVDGDGAAQRSLRSSLQKYCRGLAKAGYLSPLRGDRWLLVRDNGPKAPVWSERNKKVTDPNTGDVHDA